MTVAGVSIDALRCELSVVKQERSVAQERLEKMTVAAALATSDLAAARAMAEKHQADLAAWFKGWFQ